MIWRLALRSLAVRPLRTAVLAAGFGLGIGVMVALLGVGEVILEQAHSPALRGGGDLVVSASFGAIENARYVLAHVLGAPAIRAQRTVASPSRRESLYLIKPGLTIPVSARGGVPSLERAVGDPEVAGVAAWTDTAEDATWTSPRQEDILRAMDRFHAVPAAPEESAAARASAAPRGSPADAAAASRGASADAAAASRGSDPAPSAPRASAPPRGLTPVVPDPDSFRNSWAEWLYFNGRTPDGRTRFYLTFLAAAPDPGVRPRGVDSPGAAEPGGQTPLLSPPPPPRRRQPAMVRLQLERDGQSTNYSAAALIDADDLLARAPDLDIAGNRVRLERSQYRLTLALVKDGDARTRLDGEVVLDAPPGRSMPPTAIRGARGWVSGYVVPVLSGPLRGQLRTDGKTIDLEGATGYHDHNWGFWEGVRWQWGQVASGDLSIVYGRVFPPKAVADPDHTPGVLAVLGPDGPIGLAPDVSIVEEDTGGPKRITVNARGRGLNLQLEFAVEGSVGTRMGLTRTAGGQTMTFLQLGGIYRVAGTVGGRKVDFAERGSAETFRAAAP